MLDNAKYQKYILVAELATHLNINQTSILLSDFENMSKIAVSMVNIMKISPYLQQVFLNV